MVMGAGYRMDMGDQSYIELGVGWYGDAEARIRGVHIDRVRRPQQIYGILATRTNFNPTDSYLKDRWGCPLD